MAIINPNLPCTYNGIQSGLLDYFPKDRADALFIRQNELVIRLIQEQETQHTAINKVIFADKQDSPASSPVGACCFTGQDPECRETTEAKCASDGGVWQGDGTTCAESNCSGGGDG